MGWLYFLWGKKNVTELVKTFFALKCIVPCTFGSDRKIITNQLITQKIRELISFLEKLERVISKGENSHSILCHCAYLLTSMLVRSTLARKKNYKMFFIPNYSSAKKDALEILSRFPFFFWYFLPNHNRFLIRSYYGLCLDSLFSTMLQWYKEKKN